MLNLSMYRLASPLGEMLLVTDEGDRVRALGFADRREQLEETLLEHYGRHTLTERTFSEADLGGVAMHVESLLARYFAGDLGALDGISAFASGTAFEQRVWKVLRTIPHGQTRTYSEIARGLELTDPRAAMEVGVALGSNPVAIIVPCHRVVGKDGALKGFAWGTRRKQWLLAHEKARLGLQETLCD